jgi:GDP-mannose 6-dehydrogenase
VKISVFGMGYVGCVSAVCLASLGHEVIGVDVNQDKIKMLIDGHSPIIEEGLDELLQKNMKEGRFRATTDNREAILSSDISMVCVGTPSASNGKLDLQYIQRVCSDIGQQIKEKNGYHVIIIRSTMLPGSMNTIVLPILEQSSSLVAGKDFGLAYNPEFLREGSAIVDFYQPSRTVIGEFDCRSGELADSVYEKINAPLVHTNIETAELVKYTDNTFHALKIAFANEIGAICRVEGIDSHELMNIFCLDTKLNISSSYLRPGYAFGGSCLPKDLRAINYHAQKRDVATPVLDSILESNAKHKHRLLQLIMDTKKKKVAILGLSFKPGTDDLRESPSVDLVENLIGKGYSIKIYDRNVSLSRLMGGNKMFIEKEIPHISSLMVPDMQSAILGSEIIVIMSKEKEFATVPTLLKEGQTLIDLVRITNKMPDENQNCQKLLW